MPAATDVSPIRSRLDTRSDQFQRNRADVLEQLAHLDELLDEAAAGGGPRAFERLAKKGKLPVRERIALALDPRSPFLEISPLAGYGTDYKVGGGLVAGIGVVAGVECVLMGNDPSVSAGAFTPHASKKWTRALEIARVNRLPYIGFVETAGADLNVDPTKAAPTNVQVPFHFAESGRQFYEMTELSKLGVPVINVVFGAATAGGAYQPGMSDYNIFIRDRSKVAIAGPPLVKVATGEESDDESLGGAQMHAEVSGLADYFAADELDAIRMCRQVVGHLNWRKRGGQPTLPPDEPLHDPEDLLGVVSRDLRQPVEIRDVIARVVDGSRFDEFKARYGTTLVCGWASVHGYPIGILGNNGVLFPDSSEKGCQFIQLCNQIDVPILFLHNITGFMVGKEYERAGLVKKGSLLINAVSNSTVPHVAVVIGSSFGAGVYGMSGRAFGNRFTFLWPTAKTAVMGAKQIAGVMSMVRRGRAQRLGEEVDEQEDRRIVELVEAMQEQGSLALAATGAVADDGIIDPRDTRSVLAICLSVVHNQTVEGAAGYGVFRP